MATPRQAGARELPLRPERTRAETITGGGTTGNGLLTTATGAALLVLLAVLGVTILRIGQLLWLHLFLGMLLIGPLALKLASTGYRFVGYYSGDPAYRRKGPPALLSRLLGPGVVLSTLIVFATGVALLFAGPSTRDELLPIHKITFFFWLAFIGLHVLLHLPSILPALRSDYGRDRVTSDVTGRSGRMLALGGALVGGAVLAILVIPEFAPWVHASGSFHHHHHG
ncbi:MAG TPA: hypothetical protein VHY83_01245 [Solirubrobacteraceae bacterium]|jgi:hypothetical protein|nr:hypothetical protein [Solirubrobacteraceae bacterium]